jgi:hypothetical protein
MALNIASLDETTAQGKQYLAAIKTAAINQLGYSSPNTSISVFSS